LTHLFLLLIHSYRLPLVFWSLLRVMFSSLAQGEEPKAFKGEEFSIGTKSGGWIRTIQRGAKTRVREK
jgi:hypothetical protein